MKKLLATVSMVLLSGCAYVPLAVNIDPVVNSGISTVGQGRSVYIQVVDERPSLTIGRKADGQVDTAEITAAQNIDNVIYSVIKTQLSNKAFIIKNTPEEANASLRVDIRLLSTTNHTQDIFSPKVRVEAAIKATAINGGSKYDQIYRMHYDGSRMWNFEENISLWINGVLANTIYQMLVDPNLIETLAK